MLETSTRRNIVLIGMAGAGKSTVGVLLAKRSARDFVDTDVLIQARAGRPLQQIVDGDGYLALRAIEEQTLLGLELEGHVIATGGSAVYSEAAMAHLGQHGVRVLLDLPLAEVERRVSDIGSRGLARRPGQSLADLYRERLPLYRRHADITVDCEGLDADAVCLAVLAALGEAPV